MDTLKNSVIAIIAGALGVPADQLEENTAIGSIPEWDSVGNLAIICSLEEQLGIEIPIDDLFELNTVSSFYEEVKKLIV